MALTKTVLSPDEIVGSFVHKLLASEDYKQKPAVSCGGKTLTFDELNKQANKVANYLQKQGVGPETIVGVCVDPSLEMMVGILGVIKAGGAYLPLDPENPKERLALIIEDANPSIVLVKQAFKEILPQGPQCLVLDDAEPFYNKESEETPKVDIKPENLMYVIYTSGSTGRPKGVMVEHRNLAAFIAASEFIAPSYEGTVATKLAPYSFDASVAEIFAPLCVGGHLHIMPKEYALDPKLFVEYCVEKQITCTFIPPSILQEVVGEMEKHRDALKMNRVHVGVEPIKQGLLQRIKDLWENVRVVNGYGPTEATIVSTYFAFEKAEDPNAVTPIGTALQGYQVYLLDDKGQEVPDGKSGEIYVGGLGVARGYLNDPEKTALKFVDDFMSKDEGGKLYRTGDLAYRLPDGNLMFKGRSDFQVKIRGFRIEVGEIENALCKHPDIHKAVVLAKPDSSGQKRLAAYVASENPELTPNQIRDFLLTLVPDYMVPSAFIFFKKFPQTHNGKVDRKALPEPDFTKNGFADQYVAPSNDRERTIARHWEEVLRMDRVGIKDDFFQLGGHSLLATQVLSRIRNEFNVHLTVKDFFEKPRVDLLSELIVERSKIDDNRKIKPSKRPAQLPLAYAQERPWLLEKLEGENLLYNLPGGLEIKGPVKADVLEKSINHLVERHEILRTTFSEVDGSGVQVIHDKLPIKLGRKDLSKLANEEQQLALDKHGKALFAKPFNLNQGPLFRFELIKLAEENYVLFFDFHHIISDGWSFGVFFKELAEVYRKVVEGEENPTLKPLEIQYADYALWQREFMKTEEFARQLDYWKKDLEGIPELLQLPTDKVRPAKQSFKGAEVQFHFSADLVRRLKEVGLTTGSSLYMTILAGFNTVLSRYSRQEDIVVGSMIANRNRNELESLLGMFTNTILLRNDLSGNPTFEALLKQVKHKTLEAYANQDVPYEKLLEELKPERNLSYNPLFQVMLIYQNMELDTFNVFDSVTPMHFEKDSSKVDLTMYITEKEEELEGCVEYSTDLFEKRTIENMVEHLVNVLEDAVSNIEKPIGELQLLSKKELKQIQAWNKRDHRFKDNLPVHERFEQLVEECPNVIALEQEGSGMLTYEALNERVNRLANTLLDKGLGKNNLVGVFLERSVEGIVAILATLKAGLAYVPIDPKYPQERISMIAEDAKLSVILTNDALKGQLVVKERVNIWSLDAMAEALASAPIANPKIKVGAKDLAYVIFTSGSTGRPKGVMIEHGGLTNFVNNLKLDYGLSSKDSVLQFASFSFDTAVEEIFSALCSGGKLVLRTDDLLSSYAHFLSYVEKKRISVLDFPTAYWHQLVAEMHQKNIELPSSVRLVIIGGETAQTDYIRMWNGLPWQGKKPMLVNTYGPTEGTVVATRYFLPEHYACENMPIGQPLANVGVHVLDSNFHPLPVGVPGELFISGKGLAKGYLNRQDLTKERFVTKTIEGKRVRLYKTGDLVRFLADGNLEFLGRVDNQVKIRGFRIELGEIEGQISQCKVVKECAVLVKEIKGDKRLVAYVVFEGKEESLITELKAYLKERLPEYMIPSSFVMLEEMPLTANQKVNKKALPEPTFNGAGGNAHTSPKGKVQKGLHSIWCDVLGYECISTTDDFFELGGHSLLAVKLISSIEQKFGIRLPLANLFSHPSIIDLSAHIEDQQSKVASGEENETYDPLVPIKPSGSNIPLYLVHGLGGNVLNYYALGRAVSKEQPVFGLQAKGTEGKHRPLDRVEDMAYIYVEAILKHNPDGPYLLAGASFGGAVALEVAHQLMAAGKEVALVAMFDSIAYTNENYLSGVQLLTQKLKVALRRGLFYASKFFKEPMREKIKYYKRLQQAMKYRTKKDLEKEREKMRINGEAIPDYLSDIWYYNDQAYRKYGLKLYAGDVLLFRAVEKTFVINDYKITTSDTDYGWEEYVTGEFEIVEASGSHNSMLEDPHVHSLAKMLEDRVRKVNQRVRRKKSK